jgi:branched-chain amino acid transport system substrate-binding protein
MVALSVSLSGIALMTGSANASAASKNLSPIKIGIVCSCTGPLASSTSIGPPSYEAWADSVNASGGINGHKIDVIVKDDAFNPATSVSEAQTLVAQDHVVALVDGSDVDAGWATYAQKEGIPVVGMVSSSEPFFSNSDFFAEGQTEDQLFDSIVGAAKKVKAKSLALFYCAEAATCQEGVAPLRTAASALGVPLVYNASISASSPNYTAQCVAAKEAGAQAVFIADSVSVIASAAQSCAQQGWNPPVVVDGESLAPVMKSQNGLSSDSIFEMPNASPTSNIPAIKQMTEAFNRYEPGLTKKSNYSEINVQAWAAGELFEAAAKAGNLGANGATPTSAQLLKGLYALHGTTLNGLAPPLTFVKGQPNPVDCWANYVLLKNGKFTTPWGTNTVCAQKTAS